MSDFNFEKPKQGPDGEEEIVLDGSMGYGTLAELTVIVKEKGADTVREETFRFPFALIDQKMLSQFLTLHFIVGYRVERLRKDA